MKTTTYTSWSLAALAGLALLSGRTDAGLLAYYPFDGDFTDASGNNNDLAIAVGAPAITTTAGEHVFGGGALDLNSTISDEQYLDLSSSITLGASDAWSVSFWVRRRAASDNRQGMVIGDPVNTRDFIWATDNSSQVRGVRFRSSSNANANYGTFPDDFDWHHWVIIADGAGSVIAYRDNAPQSSVSMASAFNITTVGQAYNNNTFSMNGQIDELYIFDEALDAPAVDDLFNNVKDTTSPTLAGSDIVDDQGGGTVNVNSIVTYTVTFSEEINAGTVDAGDFRNAGTAPVSIGAISETAPGVFSVAVMPIGAGSLQLEVVAGATILDCWGNALDTTVAIVDDTTLTVAADSDPPTTSGMEPMAGASNFLPFADLTLNFNEFVQAGTGNISIHLADGTLVETIDVTSGAVSILDDEVTINPANDLLALTAYYVNIEAGAFEDLAGNDYAGIADTGTWAFTTVDVLIGYYPFDTDFTDASSAGNDLLVAVGTPTITTASGEFVVGGGALDVDSTTSDEEFLDLTTPITFGTADPWSVAFWARRRPGTDNRTGMVVGDTANNTDFIWIPDNPSQVQGLRFRSSANTNANFGGFPDDGGWHHWVVIADGSGNVDTYRDNVLQTPVAMTTSFSITSVAHAFNATTQSMDGQIDELYIYREAISATKVDELFSAAGTAAPRITSITSVGAGGGVWELTLTGANGTDYEFRSSTTLDFTPGTLVVNLTQGDPGDPGTIGGPTDSVVTTDGSGNATVRMTLTGNPAEFVRMATP